MIYKNFYAEVGKLLYALAKADNRITDEEKRAIHRMVVNDLVPLEDSTDEFGTDSAFYVEMEFDFLMENDFDPRAAFDSFILYIDEHHSAFDEKLRQAVLNVSEKLANAFHKSNKKEQRMLEKVRKKMEELAVKS